VEFELRDALTSVEISPLAAMTADEYAALQVAMGAKVVSSGGLWWRAVRPFFYRPLLPFRELSPDRAAYPALARLGGAQHLVPGGVPANSSMTLLVFDDPQSYSLESLDKSRRRDLRRSMERFVVKRLTDVDDFSTSAHPVYLSFYERTKYAYKSDRTDPRRFAEWARTLMRFPKVCVLGAYRGDELVAVGVSYVVEDTLLIPSIFAETSALAELVSESVLHTMRAQVVGVRGVNLIFAAMAGMERGLDNFYLLRGARLESKPAWLSLNPLVSIVLRALRPDSYRRLRTSG
jgi:hypothetical protein